MIRKLSYFVQCVQFHQFMFFDSWDEIEECLKSWKSKFDTFVSHLYEMSFEVLQIIQGYLIQWGECRADYPLHCVQNLHSEDGSETCINEIITLVHLCFVSISSLTHYCTSVSFFWWWWEINAQVIAQKSEQSPPRIHFSFKRIQYCNI